MSGNLTEIINTITGILGLAVPIITALALLYFLWGIAQFILNAGDTEEHKKGRDRMVWGLVTLFVIASLAGILALLQNTFFHGLR